MTTHSRKRRRRETIAFAAECAGALGGVLAVATLFFAMLGFAKLSMAIWFVIGAVAASIVSLQFDDERAARRTGAGSTVSPNSG
jgi:hypothetical protein